MYAIVIGGGKVGYYLARDLLERGDEVLLLEKDAARAEWLTDHGVPAGEIVRVRGPAGLDIGARTPPEIAVAIVAEMVAVRSGATGSPLAERDGPIHHDGLHAPPARYPSLPQST